MVQVTTLNVDMTTAPLISLPPQLVETRGTGSRAPRVPSMQVKADGAFSPGTPCTSINPEHRAIEHHTHIRLQRTTVRCTLN